MKLNDYIRWYSEYAFQITKLLSSNAIKHD